MPRLLTSALDCKAQGLGTEAVVDFIHCLHQLLAFLALLVWVEQVELKRRFGGYLAHHDSSLLVHYARLIDRLKALNGCLGYLNGVGGGGDERGCGGIAVLLQILAEPVAAHKHHHRFADTLLSPQLVRTTGGKRCHGGLERIEV